MKEGLDRRIFEEHSGKRKKKKRKNARAKRRKKIIECKTKMKTERNMRVKRRLEGRRRNEPLCKRGKREKKKGL